MFFSHCLDLCGGFVSLAFSCRKVWIGSRWILCITAKAPPIPQWRGWKASKGHFFSLVTNQVSSSLHVTPAMPCFDSHCSRWLRLWLHPKVLLRRRTICISERAQTLDMVKALRNPRLRGFFVSGFAGRQYLCKLNEQAVHYISLQTQGLNSHLIPLLPLASFALSSLRLSKASVRAKVLRILLSGLSQGTFCAVHVIGIPR